jgi:hypothetical protein
MTKNVRNILIAVACAVAIYSLCGFFLVPYIVQVQMERTLLASLGAKPQIQDISFNPFTFKMKVQGFLLPEADPRAGAKPRLQFDEFAIQLAVFPLFKKELRFKDVIVKSLNGKAVVFKDGTTNWKVTPSPQENKESQGNSSDWILTLEHIQIDNSGLHITDNTHITPLELPLGPFSLNAANISTSLGSETSLHSLAISVGDSGHLKVSGSLKQTPLSVDVNLDVAGLPLDFVTAYLSDKSFLSLRHGTIDLLGKLKYGDGNLALSANSEIHDVDLALPETEQAAIAWQNLKLSNVEFTTKPLLLTVAEIDLLGLQTTLILKKDGRLNYRDFLRPSTKSEPSNTPTSLSADTKTSPAFDYLISKLSLSDSEVDYTDQQIKPSFTAHVHNITGTIGPFSPRAEQKINIDLNGQIESYGKFKALGYFIPGAKRPSLDLGMGFNNIELTTFTPYSGHFAGYEISKGKLFLDLKYVLANNRIKGKNQVLLDQFTLGKKVESEHSTNLPVKLALALMKDRKGQIKFQLPVEGDLNSPSFSWGNLIFTALKNMLINIATAPFTFISSLFGGGDDLQNLLFEAGATQMVNNENAKIQSLAQALEERPNLDLEIQGQYSDQDIEALKLNDLNTQLEPLLKSNKGNRPDAVRTLAKSTFTSEEMKNEDLEKTWLSKDVIPEEQLKALALARGQVIIKTLTEAKIPAERLYLLAAAKGENEKGPQTKLSLKEK